MKGIRSRRAALIASLAAGLVAASVLVANGATARTASPTLVVDNSFTIKTSDPGRAFDPTASLVDHALYDTLFTYKGGDLAHPIPLLVSSYKVSANAKTYTFKLKRNVHFADGTPLTSADVAWSLRRLVNLKGNPSFLLAGITVSAPSKYTVVARSKTPATAAAGDPCEPVDGRPQLGAGEEERRHRRRERGQGRQGGELAQLHRLDRRRQRPVHAERLQHDLADHADAEHAATGARRSRRWSSVVVRNMVAATQLLNVGRGSHEIAVDLSADQALTLNEQQERQGLASALDLDLLRLGQRRPEGLRRSRRTRTSRRRSGTGSTTPRSSSLAGQGGDPGARASSRRCSSARFRRARASRRTSRRPRRRWTRVGRRRPEGDADLPERPDDQRRPVHLDGAEDPGEPQGGRLQRRALGLAHLELARRLPVGEVGVRALALGPRLPRPRRLPRLHPRPARRPPRRLAEGRRPGDREARRQGDGDHERPPRARSSTGRSSGCSTRAARSSR